MENQVSIWGGAEAVETLKETNIFRQI
jgi:hypothetical protein